MPLYEYQCEACGQRFEVIQKFSDSPPDVCTKCGKGPVHRLMSSPAIQFKGSGFYITDYKKSSGGAAGGESKGAAKADKKESKSTGGGGDAKSSPSKSP